MSRAWRDCIKKIYEVDPLCCPKCNGEMRIISFITDEITIKEILSHLGLWSSKPSRDPPKENSNNKINELVYEPIDDSWPALHTTLRKRDQLIFRKGGNQPVNSF